MYVSDGVLSHSSCNALVVSCFVVPSSGSFAVWSGCYVSQTDAMVVLACPAINGFHSLVTYNWERDGSTLPGEDTPLLYCCQEGMYSCDIKGTNLNYTQEFKVFSKLNV